MQAITAHSAFVHKIRICSCIRPTDKKEIDRNDDPVPLTLDLLNPKRGFDGLSRTTTLPSFKSFWSGVFVLSCWHTHPNTHTHIVTKWSLYPRRRTTLSARIQNA